MGDVKTSERVKLYLDDETGLHYIVGRESVLLENGVKIPRDAFENRFKDRRPLADIVREARENPENCNWDFKKTCKTANLTKAPVVKPKAAPKVAEKKAPKIIEEPKVDVLKDTVSRAKAFFSVPHADIVIIATVIGIACAFMSMYHAYVFLNEVNGKPPAVALVTAFTMVLFAASAFTIARHLASDDKIGFGSRLIFPPVFVALGLGVIWFLVFSTITVNFEQFKARDAAKETAFVESDTSVSRTNDALTTKDKEIANAESDVARLTKQSDDWYAEYMTQLPKEASSEDVGEQKKIDARLAVATNKRNVAYKNYTDAQKQLTAATARRDALMRERSGLIEKAETATTTARSKRETVYTVVASKTGIPETTLQFLVYVIPPTFFDIVSPVTLSVVLLLRDRRRDTGEKKRGALASFIAKMLKKEVR